MLKNVPSDHRKATRTVNIWINMRIVYGKVLTFNNFWKSLKKDLPRKLLLWIWFQKVTLLDGTKVNSSDVSWSPGYPRCVPKKSVSSIHFKIFSKKYFIIFFMLTFIRLFSKIDLTFRLFQQLLKGQKGLGLVFLQNYKNK